MPSASSVRVRNVLGLLLIGIGWFLFAFLLLYIVPYGLVAGLAFGWVVVILICSGCFILLRVPVRRNLPSFLIVSIGIIGCSLILFLNLPGESQILLFSVVASAFLLSYNFFAKRFRRQHS